MQLFEIMKWDKEIFSDSIQPSFPHHFLFSRHCPINKKWKTCKNKRFISGNYQVICYKKNLKPICREVKGFGVTELEKESAIFESWRVQVFSRFLNLW